MFCVQTLYFACTISAPRRLKTALVFVLWPALLHLGWHLLSVLLEQVLKTVARKNKCKEKVSQWEQAMTTAPQASVSDRISWLQLSKKTFRTTNSCSQILFLWRILVSHCHFITFSGEDRYFPQTEYFEFRDFLVTICFCPTTFYFMYSATQKQK